MGPLFDPNWYKDENYEKFKSIQNGNNNNLASLSGGVNVYSTLGNTAQLVGDVASMTQADDSMGHNKLNTYKNISVGAADSIEGLHSIERNITSAPNISWSDVGGKSGGEVGAGILKGAGSGTILGANIGSVVPGLGTVIGGAVGAGVGAIASGIGSIFGSNKAKRQRRRLQEQAELAHQKQLADFQVQVGNVNQNITDKAQFNSFGIGGCLSPFNIFAQGGYVPQQKNVSTHIDNGGTHEMNKLGGVPMGVADDGQPNLVEQGEVVYNDYVYSNRLSPDEKLLKKYGLPTKYRGKTYANIAKALEKEIEERKNDSISKLGYETNMKKLQSAHEEHKQLLEQAQQQDMLQNYTQGLTPQYADGGPLVISLEDLIKYDNSLSEKNHLLDNNKIQALQRFKTYLENNSDFNDSQINAIIQTVYHEGTEHGQHKDPKTGKPNGTYGYMGYKGSRAEKYKKFYDKNKHNEEAIFKYIVDDIMSTDKDSWKTKGRKGFFSSNNDVDAMTNFVEGFTRPSANEIKRRKTLSGLSFLKPFNSSLNVIPSDYLQEPVYDNIKSNVFIPKFFDEGGRVYDSQLRNLPQWFIDEWGIGANPNSSFDSEFLKEQGLTQGYNGDNNLWYYLPDDSLDLKDMSKADMYRILSARNQNRDLMNRAAKSFYSPIKDMVSFVLNPGIPETTGLIDKKGNEIPLPTIADKLGIPTDVSNKINKTINFVTDPIGNLIYRGTGNEDLATVGSAVVGAINPKGYIPKSRTGLASRANLPNPDFTSAMNRLLEEQAKKLPKETRTVLKNKEKTSKLNTNSKEEQAEKLSKETRKALKNEEEKKDYIPKDLYSRTGLPGSRYIKSDVGKYKNLTEKQAERLSKETREALKNNDTYTAKEVRKQYKTDINNNKKKLEEEISKLSTNLKKGKITKGEYNKKLTKTNNEFVKKKNEIENKYTFNQKHPYWTRSILYPAAGLVGLGGLGFGAYELFRNKNNNTTEETPNIESRNENNNTTEETPNIESSEIEIKPVKTDTEIPVEDTLNFTKEFQDSLMSKAFMNKALGGHLFVGGGSPKGTRKTYVYDKNMNNFAHYHNGKYDQGYLDFLNNMTQDDWDRYYKTYLNNNPNAFDRYNTAYNGQPTLQQAIALGQDGKYSDLHKMLGDTYSAIKNNTWFDTSDEVLPDLEYNYIITPFKTTVDTSQVDNMMKNRKKNYNVPAPYDYNSYLRYAPVISSGINAITDAFGWTNRPDYSGINEIENAYKNAPYVHYQPLKHYMKYQPIDRDYYLNKYNNQFANSRDLISRGTNGNSAQNALMQLVNNKTYNEGVADQEMRANLYNQNERNKVYDFNRATDQYNSQQDFNAQSTNANLYRQDISALHQLLEERKAEQQAAAALRNANRQNLLQNLYNIGEEAYNRNTINYLAKRGALDTYLTPADRYRYWNAYANQNKTE